MQAQRTALEQEGWTVKLASSDASHSVATAWKSPFHATLWFTPAKEAMSAGDGKVVVRLQSE